MYVLIAVSRGTDQKLSVMAPVLLTGLTKITDQPDEVIDKIHIPKYLTNSHFRMRNFMCWPTLESVVWLSESV